MTTPDLAAYEAAYDHVGQQLRLEADAGRLESRVRRKLRAPDWALAWTVTLIVLSAGATFFGVTNGWMVALGLLFAALPGRIQDVKRRREALRAIETADDVSALALEDARRRMAGAVLGALAMTGMGLLFVVTGLIAWWIGKTPLPGLVSGGLLIVYGIYQFFVRFPRAAREAEAIEQTRRKKGAARG